MCRRALVGEARVDEAVEDDGLATGQPRGQLGGDQLGPGGREQQRLGVGVEGAGLDEVADALGQWLAARLAQQRRAEPLGQALFEAVVAGATTEDIEGVRVVRRAALSATASDVLAADGYLLGTPANLGYMSGALKHFFDQIYYPCLDQTVGRPFGLYVHGGSDVAGAVRDILKITGALGWEQVAEVCESTGEIGTAQREAA